MASASQSTVAEAPAAPPLRVPCQALLDGAWTPLYGATFTVTDKANDAPLAMVTDVAVDDVDRAMGGAWRGFLRWRATPARHRADALRRAYELLIERTEELARLISLEMGKALPDSRGEVAYA